MDEPRRQKGLWIGLLFFMLFIGAIGWVAIRSRPMTAGQASDLLMQRIKRGDAKGMAAFIQEAEVKEYFLDRAATEKFTERVLLPLIDAKMCTVSTELPDQLEAPIVVTFVGKQGHSFSTELYFHSEAYRHEVSGLFRCMFRATAILNYDEAKAKAAGKGATALTEEDYLVQTHKTVLADVGLKIIPDRTGKSEFQRKLESVSNPPIPMGAPYSYKP